MAVVLVGLNSYLGYLYLNGRSSSPGSASEHEGIITCVEETPKGELLSACDNFSISIGVENESEADLFNRLAAEAKSSVPSQDKSSYELRFEEGIDPKVFREGGKVRVLGVVLSEESQLGPGGGIIKVFKIEGLD